MMNDVDGISGRRLLGSKNGFTEKKKSNAGRKSGQQTPRFVSQSVEEAPPYEVSVFATVHGSR